MVGRRREKNCVECGKRIGGYKDYCTSCHARILEKIKKEGKKTLIPPWWRGELWQKLKKFQSD